MNLTILSGKIFNERYSGCAFSVLLKDDSTDDDGYMYKDGMNEDIYISIDDTHSKGGFHFFDEKNKWTQS